MPMHNCRPIPQELPDCGQEHGNRIHSLLTQPAVIRPRFRRFVDADAGESARRCEFANQPIPDGHRDVLDGWV